MNANRIQGSLLRLPEGREIAIYLRYGVPSIVEFRDGQGELHSAGGWMSVNGRKVAHAQRRGEAEMVSPIPAEVAVRIERLHRHIPLAQRCATLFQRFFGGVPARSANSAI
jgi:hypothetical protein